MTLSFEDLLGLRERVFVEFVGDAGDGQLLIKICVGGHRPKPRDFLGKHVDEIAATPIEYEDARSVTLRWKRVFTFMVRDETIAACRSDETSAGRPVRQFTESWLLRAVPELSNGTHALPALGRAQLLHFRVYGSDHVIDILAWEKPLIEDLGLMPLASHRPHERPRRMNA